MKKITTEQEFSDCQKGIIDSLELWKHIKENGCNDPTYPDGCNMNLVRNHILYYKSKILEICNQEGFSIPEEYYFATPPEVSQYFMANLRQKKRVRRLKKLGNPLMTKRIDFDEQQLSLF